MKLNVYTVWFCQFALAFTAWVFWPRGSMLAVGLLFLAQQIGAFLAADAYLERERAVQAAIRDTQRQADLDWGHAVRSSGALVADLAAPPAQYVTCPRCDRDQILGGYHVCEPTDLSMSADLRPVELHEHVVCARCDGLHAVDLAHICTPEHGMTRCQYPDHE
jgi:hypothetical protein